MIVPRACQGDDHHSSGAEISDPYEFDAVATADDNAATEAHFAGLRYGAHIVTFHVFGSAIDRKHRFE